LSASKPVPERLSLPCVSSLDIVQAGTSAAEHENAQTTTRRHGAHQLSSVRAICKRLARPPRHECERELRAARCGKTEVDLGILCRERCDHAPYFPCCIVLGGVVCAVENRTKCVRFRTDSPTQLRTVAVLTKALARLKARQESGRGLERTEWTSGVLLFFFTLLFDARWAPTVEAPVSSWV
jgi:hypothetical protein